jgi:hypothetical protein
LNDSLRARLKDAYRTSTNVLYYSIPLNLRKDFNPQHRIIVATRDEMSVSERRQSFAALSA